MKRNILTAVLITAASMIVLGQPALAKSGHGHGNGGSNSNGSHSGHVPTTPPKPTIRPGDPVKDAIWRAINGGVIVNDCGCIEGGG